MKARNEKRENGNEKCKTARLSAFYIPQGGPLPIAPGGLVAPER
jgi:hypothetical protein